MNSILFRALFLRECVICYRQGSDYLLAMSFWLLIVTFFPLSSTASPQLLQSFAPGVIWLGLLLTQLLHLPKIFREDYQQGLLSESIQSPHDFLLIILCKLFIFWTIYYLPILILAPFLGMMLHLPYSAIGTLEWTILLGSPTLTLFSSFVAALTVSIKNSTLLINLLFLPLTTPILIFATGAISDSVMGLPDHAAIAWLGVILLLALLVIPTSIVFVLKANLD